MGQTDTHALPPREATAIERATKRREQQSILRYLYNRYIFRAISLLVIILFGYQLFQPISLRERRLSLNRDISQTPSGLPPTSLADLCPRVGPILPSQSTPEIDIALENLRSPEYLSYSAGILGKAVQTRTDINDEFGLVGRDKQWEKMEKFVNLLKDTFPLLHKRLKLKRVNTYGLLYTWVGSNPDFKPIALAGHYDTVGVAAETESEWTHPPYSGYLDTNGKLYGRGALDDKNQVFAVMEAVQLLLKAGFKPRRTVLLCFGFDEENGGEQGAQNIGLALHERYGPGGVALIIDEGTALFNQFGSKFMVISTAEKGYANQKITVRTPGGHSSVPPRHTGIGIMAELITEIENHPYDIRLAEDNPLFNFLTCAAAYATEFPDDLKGYIRNGDRQSLAEGIVKLVPRYEIDVRTTIAVTKIDGGIKVNALPQSVTAFINHRIRRGSNWSEVTGRTEELAAKVAQKHGLELMAYPDNATYPQLSITLELQDEKNPSAFTPIRTDISTPYRLIAGTTRAVFGDEFIVTSGLNMGNTDMKWYANVTDNIFRYAPMPAERASLHGLNECVEMKGHVSMVEWFFTFLRNADETEFDV